MKYKYFYSNYKTIFSYFSFSIATSAIGLLSSIVMMQLMPPEQFGRYALFMSIQFIAVPLVSFSADSLIAINKSKLTSTEYEYFRYSYVTFSYIMFAVVQSSFFLFYYMGILNDTLFLLIPLYGLILFLIGMANNEYVMEEKPVQYGIFAFGTAVTSFLLTIIFMYLFSGVADWRVYSSLIANILFVFIRYHHRMKLLCTFQYDKVIFKNVVKFGFPLLLSVAPAWALNEADKLILSKYTDLESLGYYAAAVAIGGITTIFNAALLNVLTPKIYAALSDNPIVMSSTTKKYLMVFTGISATFALLFMLIYWLIADLILPIKYVTSREIVYAVIIFSLFRGLYAVIGLVTDYYGMTIAKLIGVGIAGIIAVLLTILGVIRFGAIGATFGIGIGYLTLSLILWISLQIKAKSLQHKLY
jgi:O-antigen/teichoic acid export membrane protein